MSRGPGIRYEITVAGHLDDHWSHRLGGLDIAHSGDGTSVLSGRLADQAQLHGVLSGLRDIGVDLLALRCVGPEPVAGRGGDRAPGSVTG